MPILLVAFIGGKCWLDQGGTIKGFNIEFINPANANSIPTEELINYIDVRKTDLNIDSLSRAFINDALPRLFANNNPHQKMYDRLSTENWEKKWQEYRTALIERASKNGLAVESLQACLKQIEPKAPLALLPIAAYLAKNGNDDIWIIVCKWGLLNEDYQHFRIWAFNARTAKKIGFSTCS